MSTINQINNLSNATASQLSSSSSASASGTSQNADWFTDDATDASQTITASAHFDSGTTIDQMSQSILSCIGNISKP
ncbi:MAG: hypothetical protein ABW104_04120 [Candidatus Thiodiazotropha sp. 6PLUC2]